MVNFMRVDRTQLFWRLAAAAGAVGLALAGIAAAIAETGAHPRPLWTSPTMLAAYSVLGLALLLGLFALTGGHLLSFRLVGPSDLRRKGGVFDRININDDLFKNKSIDITDFTRSGYLIRDKAFQECDIVGPAVMTLTGDLPMLRYCRFDPFPQETIYWDVPPGPSRAGIVEFRSCQFVRCWFIDVGITGSKEQLDSLRQSLRFPAVLTPEQAQKLGMIRKEGDIVKRTAPEEETDQEE